MEEIMQGKVKRFRWVAIVGLALLVVPIAQAKPVTFSKLQQGETAQGLKADGMRLQAEAQAYLRSQGSSSSAATGYKYGGDVMGAQVHYPFATSAAATGYRYSGDVMGVQVHYPFANENTAAFKAAEQKENGTH